MIPRELALPIKVESGKLVASDDASGGKKLCKRSWCLGVLMVALLPLAAPWSLEVTAVARSVPCHSRAISSLTTLQQYPRARG